MKQLVILFLIITATAAPASDDIMTLLAAHVAEAIQAGEEQIQAEKKYNQLLTHVRRTMTRLPELMIALPRRHYEHYKKERYQISKLIDQSQIARENAEQHNSQANDKSKLLKNPPSNPTAENIQHASNLLDEIIENLRRATTATNKATEKLNQVLKKVDELEALL